MPTLVPYPTLFRSGYVDHFHPRLVGLTGTAEQIAAAPVVFGVHADRSPAAANGSYLMNHSLLTFLLGRDGRHLETFLSGSEPEAMAARIRRHVELDFVKGFLLRPPALAPAYEAFAAGDYARSEEHTSDLQALMRISYAVFCLQ